MENVPNMPHRVVCKKTLEDERLVAKKVEAGTILDLNNYDFEMFQIDFPEYFEEIEMTQEDWINLTTRNFNESAAKLRILRSVSNIPFQSYYEGCVPAKGTKVRPTSYGGDLSDIYTKSKIFQREVDDFEKKVEQSIVERQGRNDDGNR